jgi:hypothetical protein
MYVDLVVLDELGYLPFSQAGGALLFHLLSKLYEHTSVAITTNLSFTEWASRVWRCQDDDGATGPADPSLPYRRDRQRVIPLSSQHGYGEIAHQGTGTEQARQADGAVLSRARVGKSASGYALRGFPNANLSPGYATGRKRRCSI